MGSFNLVKGCYPPFIHRLEFGYVANRLYRGSRMYRFRLLAIGSPKPGPFASVTQDYARRMSPYARVEETALKEEKFRSANERGQVWKHEAEALKRASEDGAFRILLNERGKTYASEAFAQQVDRWAEGGARTVEFWLGGPLGTDPTLEKEADAVLSLSPMTFPHELARVMLHEQLYRAMTILRGKTYHY